MILSGWRIAHPDFARTPEQMLSGEGAYLYGGRWNSRGVSMVYLGTSLAQAAMELLVHLDRHEVLEAYHKVQVSFEDALVSHIRIEDLPENWASPSMASPVRQVGDRWVEEQVSVILQVPSASIPGEYNFLLNPAHPDVDKLQVGPVSTFSYDPRLQK